MLRRFQLALQIVVLERRREEEHGIEHHPDKRQAPRETTAPCSSHLHRLYALRRPAQRPTTSLNRPATPPRSVSPACCETPPVPRIPGTWLY